MNWYFQGLGTKAGVTAIITEQENQLAADPIHATQIGLIHGVATALRALVNKTPAQMGAFVEAEGVIDDANGGRVQILVRTVNLRLG